METEEIKELKKQILTDAKTAGRMTVMGAYTSEDHAMDNAKRGLDKLCALIERQAKGK